MKKTLLLVFVHGFHGSDTTFDRFPHDLRALLSHALPKINVVSVQYPQFETRGDLRQCVAKFKEWLQNHVIDLEVANRTPSPTVDPSVRVVLCGHSMGGIVARDTLLSIAKDEPILPSYSENTSNTTASDPVDRPTSIPPLEPSRLFFPYIQGILAFDTPFLGISPGVLAHGAEEHFNQASSAYKAFDQANQYFGSGSTSTQPLANASSRALPAANGISTGGWNRWGKLAMYGGAAAAIAGAAGAAYLNRNQIGQGLTWAGSHLEFVGCLARGAELQKRVEDVVALTKTHAVGFGNFYAALGEQVTSKTKYAGSVLGADRTFCVVPKDVGQSSNSAGRKRDAPELEKTPPKRRKTDAGLGGEMQDAEQVEEYAKDTSKSKGQWVKCINHIASDELKAHTSMFTPRLNPDYHAMVDRARTQIAEWIDRPWYESSEGGETAATAEGVDLDDADAGG